MNITQRTWLEKLENVLNDYDALNVRHLENHNFLAI